jgi:tRNA-modifying protein YgfZ
MDGGAWQRNCDTTGMFWFDSPRDVVRVSGPDAQTYLQSQLSQDLRSMTDGDSAWSFVLQPTGKVDVLLRITRNDAETFILDTDAGFGEVMVARLNRFKIRVKADIETVGWRCVALRGDDANSVAGVVAWGDGVDLLGADVTPPTQAVAGTEEQFELLRIEAAWPRMGAEITPGESVPAESGVISAAVSFTKGCYPGQELVERMDSRGASAPRSVRRVTVAEGSAPGDGYEVDGVEVGTITSVIGTEALALVKRGA